MVKIKLPADDVLINPAQFVKKLIFGAFKPDFFEISVAAQHIPRLRLTESPGHGIKGREQFFVGAVRKF